MLRLVIGVLLGLLASSPAVAKCVPVGPSFIRGDADGDGLVLVNDAIFSLDALFGPGSFGCESAGDVNDSGTVDVADVIYLLSYLFISGPEIPPPFPDCGEDFYTFDSLTCTAPIVCDPYSDFLLVLNAPSLIGGGNDSVVLVEIAPDGTETFESVLPPDGSWNGLRFIEYSFDGLIAVQEDLSTGTNRVVQADLFSGAIYSEVTGIPGTVRAMSSDGFSTYLITTDDTPSIQLVRIEIYTGDPPQTLWSGPGEYDVSGMGVDFQGNVYFAAVGPTESGIFRVDPSGTLTTSIVLPEVGQLRAQPSDLSMLQQTSSGELSLQIFGIYGYLVAEYDLASTTPNPVGDFGLISDFVYVPVPAEDQVLILNRFGGTSDSWTSLDGIDHPIDVASPAFFGIP